MKNVLLFMLLLPFSLTAQLELNTELVASGFDNPLDIIHRGTDKLYIVEKHGIIKIMDTLGNVLPDNFMDINPRVGSSQNEQGLLGLEFHPNFEDNRQFFVNYTNNSGNTIVSRFYVDSMDWDVALEDSEEIIMEIEQPFGNHNGGDLAFGPDGYLYIGTGDGGAGGDPLNSGQDPMSLLGKMLRIDVDSGIPYSIPESNPFVDDDSVLDEVWALGMRNPWRYSFDRKNGDLWIGDVGQDAAEEIDFQSASSEGGENYGWRCYEGDFSFNTNGCDEAEDYVFPVHQVTHQSQEGCSITGGYVYRGVNFPRLRGLYIYADFCNGLTWALFRDNNNEWVNIEVMDFDGRIATFGEDAQGELYLANYTDDGIYKISTPLTSTQEINLSDFVQIGPNPATNLIQIQSEVEDAQVVIFNEQGRIHYEQPVPSNIEVDASNWAPGVYYVRWNTQEIGGTKKIVLVD